MKISPMSKSENQNEIPAEISTISYTMENGSDVKKHNQSLNGPEATKLPPEGGWGWIVCLTSMMSNGAVFGLMTSYGIIYKYLLDSPDIVGSDQSSVALKTSVVGSVLLGTFFFMTFFAGILCDRFGIRQTGVFGAVVGALGLLSSAFVTQLWLLYLTFGVVLGVGAGCVFVPSTVILGHYFKDRIGLASGLVNCGSPLYTIILSLTLPKLLHALQFKFTLFVLCGFYLIMTVGALSWKPLLIRKIHDAKHKEETPCITMKKIFNFNLLKNRKFLVWFLSFAVAMFGQYVLSVHLIKHSADRFPDSDGYLLLTVMQVSIMITRLVLGEMSDNSCINRVHMHQIAFLLNGIIIACIPFTSNFEVLMVLIILIGASEAAIISLVPPIIIDIVGPHKASVAIGILYGSVTIPLSLGPPVAGFLYDHTGDYTASFIVASCFRITGALLMCFMRSRTRVYRLKEDTPSKQYGNDIKIKKNGSV